MLSHYDMYTVGSIRDRYCIATQFGLIYVINHGTVSPNRQRCIKPMKAPNRRISAFEKCGFIVHIFILLLTSAYLISIARVEPLDVMTEWEILNFLPDRSWTIIVPSLLVGLLMSTPHIYFALNSWSVAKPDSIDCLRDCHSRPADTQFERPGDEQPFL
jgi:hypothetical protein